MRILIPALLILLTAAVTFTGATSADNNSANDNAAGNNAAAVESPNGPIVVELFTSQGCSSCPPADRLFSNLSGDVIQLAFHVDYWNHLGWRDPFSDARWSERQRRYGDVFERGYVYTPQLVVNGSAEAVGSDRRAVQSMLRDAAASKPAAMLELVVQPGSDQLDVAVEGRLGATRPAELLLAVTESGFDIDVKAGENRGRSLLHQHVVRELHPIATLKPSQPLELTTTLPIGADWKRNHLSVVAFVQDPDSLEILGAAVWSAEG